MYQINKLTLVFLGLFVLLAQGAFYLFERSAEQDLKEAIYQQAAQTIFDQIQHQIQQKQQTTLMLNMGISDYLSQTMGHNSELDQQRLNQLIGRMDELLQQLTENTLYKNIWFQIADINGHSLYRSWSPIKEEALPQMEWVDYRKPL